MFPAIRGNGAIRRNYVYPRIVCWFHIRRLTWTKVYDLFDVDQDEAHQQKKKMIASDVEASTPHYLSYITSLNCESSGVPSSVRYNIRNDVRNEDMVYTPQKSNRVNDDDHVGNPPEYDSRKQIAKDMKKKKKEVVASDIVDTENHIPRPPVVKEGRPIRQLKPSQYLSSPYILVQNVPRYRTGGVIHNEQPPPYLSAIPRHFYWSRLLFDMHQPTSLVLHELWMDTLSLNLHDSFQVFGAVKIIHFVRFEELMDRIPVEIGYWNHMGLPVLKASITVADVTDVP
ncbi:unnamed protein product [Lactuca saligna]|uniref:Uncharacterized protein n=1 Tax=Lactuca saligna TaxID=75948 RepID=A0AA35Z2B4_LACSI|nr:unnamed protein product [Lactuca saligna]